MAPKDTLLSLDLGLQDCLYRIRRDDKGNRRVIYVTVKDLDIIPEESRTYGPGRNTGIIPARHGDINRDNIFITNDGVRFIDFEESCVNSAGSNEGWDRTKSEEMQSLAENLSDSSGKGRPWTTINSLPSCSNP
ncbi:hypothetical protein P175DRAFT_0498121 [Aspergillus ochraceoroseus IBT 24754]|uniref:Protein kinase domain-containing protein n=1 Tax=Aspergillus ochraceoroseus IBT 24754 TaxID=1392256 RepID=A0A2T5M906_9EURO|nr:uncharacterized protein P175DRAFT_0498121 [Aspergillus ochraceoroseus IBT 24754]PTU25018.1 hypothetical protein P175DRAFT_0498121 [Aspergillus ochraceoroseus IBT 24754]